MVSFAWLKGVRESLEKKSHPANNSPRFILSIWSDFVPVGCIYTPDQVSFEETSAEEHPYRRSFSIRSTCVIIILLQQYLLQPSWSIASLFTPPCQNCLCRHELGGMNTLQKRYPPVAGGIVPRDRRRPAVRQLSNPTATPGGRQTLPQEKQRMGIIMSAVICGEVVFV